MWDVGPRALSHGIFCLTKRLIQVVWGERGGTGLGGGRREGWGEGGGRIGGREEVELGGGRGYRCAGEGSAIGERYF